MSFYAATGYPLLWKDKCWKIAKIIKPIVKIMNNGIYTNVIPFYDKNLLAQSRKMPVNLILRR